MGDSARFWCLFHKAFQRIEDCNVINIKGFLRVILSCCFLDCVLLGDSDAWIEISTGGPSLRRISAQMVVLAWMKALCYEVLIRV